MQNNHIPRKVFRSWYAPAASLQSGCGRSAEISWTFMEFRDGEPRISAEKFK